ncbi:Terpenoid synthase [Penicillium camemberti]|uniref:Terpenoid synthase n=1 Tax=Penicillium camemberti (strain FM 013) TaxID=1429867 RepID=A0A0G4PCQ9_PENC3|nr:Terpenoid synthase [Penicillium camemberti]
MDFISNEELSNILVEFLDKFGYKDEDRLSHSDLQAIYDYTLPFLPDDEKIVLSLSEYVHCTFPFLPLQIRKAVAVYDSFQMSVDDVPEEKHDSLHELCIQLSERRNVQHPVWNGLFSFFPTLLQFYGPYAQTTIFRGALEFIQATCVERTLFKGFPDSNYPNYIRRMSAQGPVQAAICFPESEFPQDQYLSAIVSLEAELEYYVGTVNDVFSFYKESDTVFDRINFPLNEAICSGKPCSEILRQLVDVSIACRNRVRKMLESIGDRKLSDRAEQFFIGYVRYHLACSRYKIDSLCAVSNNARLREFYDMSLQAVGQPTKLGPKAYESPIKASYDMRSADPCDEKKEGKRGIGIAAKICAWRRFTWQKLKFRSVVS